MEYLHDDIVLKILSYVPNDSVSQCKLVCKTWRMLMVSHGRVTGLLFSIASESERNIHLRFASYDEIFNHNDPDEHYSFKNSTTYINHPPINRKPDYGAMIGSCNGLVCFSIRRHGLSDPVYICNPISREYVNLPRLNSKRGYIVSGFGYLRSSNVYKVVRIYYPDKPDQPFDLPDDTTVGWAQVYTLGRDGGGWRNVGAFTHTLWLSGVFVNQSIYFMDDKHWKIVVFDLADEAFRLLPSPPCLQKRVNSSYYVQVLGGCLYLVHHDEGKRVDMWSFKLKEKKTNCYDKDCESWSWTMEFSIPWITQNQYDYYQPFAITKTNELLMWLNGSNLCYYDPKTEVFKKIVNADRSLKNFQGVPHMNSQISLKDFGLRSKIREVKITTTSAKAMSSLIT